jgi:hypothetical protein
MFIYLFLCFNRSYRILPVTIMIFASLQLTLWRFTVGISKNRGQMISLQSFVNAKLCEMHFTAPVYFAMGVADILHVAVKKLSII